MTDLRKELRRALGDPPSDPSARQRALVRLRAEMQEAHTPPSGSRSGSKRIRIAVAALVSLTTLLGVIGFASLEHPAAAEELDRLAHANLTWARGRDLSHVRIEQMGTSGYTSLDDGSSFTMVVRSLLSRTLNDDGSVHQTVRVLSAEFASAQDRATWQAMGSPKRAQVGDVAADDFDTRIYDLDAVSTDPETLLRALQDGSVSGDPLDDEQLFETIGSLFGEPGLTPEQRVTLYQVVGMLDGVDLLGETTDPLGRVGVGFSTVVGSSQQILIFDRNTGQLLATQDFYIDDPSLRWEWQALDPPPS